MSFAPHEYLRHMLREAEFLVESTRELSKAAFLQDEILRRALVRSIEVIGEAARQLPADFRSVHPEIDWRAMAGMRDHLIHGYFGIDYDIVWNVAVREAAPLRNGIKLILAEEPTDL